MKCIWDCDLDQNKIIEKGVVVVFPCIWAYRENNTMTPFRDIRITIEEDTRLVETICLGEEAALSFVKSHGAEDIRQYYFEDAVFEDNELIIFFGT